MSNNDPNPPIDQPSTSVQGSGQNAPPNPNYHSTQSNPQLMPTSMYGANVGGNNENPTYVYSQPSVQQPYYYQTATSMAYQQVPQRSPIPSSLAGGHGDPNQMPPQIMVPKSDSQGPHNIPQHSPASAQRLQRPMSGQSVGGWPPMDPNDPSQQHPGPPPHYAPPQMMAQPGQQLHNYPQGMGPPPGYWPSPQVPRYAYPGGDPSMQPPPMHMPGPHPYYLQVPPQHHAYGGQPKMEYQNGPNDPNMQPPSSTAQPTGSQEDEEAKRRLQQQPNMHLSPAAYPPQNQPPPGMHRPPMHPSQMMPPHHLTGQPQPASQIPPYIPTPYTHLLKPAQKEAVEKLVGIPSEFVPHHAIPQRREFFEQLVLINNEQGEQLTAPPQVSKSSIDLHRLYIAVRRKGGFENVTKDKSWKALCPEANSKMTESSAAGYQLRRHYQKYLLFLECRETGRSFEDLKEFAEKLKKKKKEKEPGAGGEGPSTPAQNTSTAGPPTPNSIRSAATPTPQHNSQQPQPSPSTFPNGPPHHNYPGMHGPPPGHPAYVGPSDPQAAAYYYQQQQNQHAAAMAQNPQGMPPPSGWPGAYPPGNYAPPHPQMRGPPYYSGQPHQQQPATSMEYQPQPNQNLGPGSAQPPPNNDRPSSSMSGAAGTQVSRPPSQAPPSVSSTHNLSHQPPPSTPDNRSQAGEGDRPSSRQPPASHRPGHTPTPTSSVSNVLGQPPPQAMWYGQVYDGGNLLQANRTFNLQRPVLFVGAPGQVPPPNSQAYYGPPGSYPQRMPSQAGPQSAKSPYPPPSGVPFQGMEPPNFIQSQHHPSMYPPGQHQPGMWPPPHHPSGVPPPVQMNAAPSQQPPIPGQRYGLPGGKPQAHMAQQNAQVQPDFRRPPAPMSQVPPAPYFPAAAQQMPSPGSSQRSRQNPAQSQPSASTSHHHHQSQQRYPVGHHQQHPGSQVHFAPHSLEATASKRALAFKRPRTFARDFAWAPQRRLMMSLRSGLESDFAWAMNALTAFLYDDTQSPLRLDQAEPQILGVLVEHLRATLALLYPQVDFNVNAAKELKVDEVVEMEVDEGKSQKMNPVVVKNLPAIKQPGAIMASIASILAPSSSSSTTASNYTLKTRTDRQVKVEPNSKKPMKLQRLCQEQSGLRNKEKDIGPAELKLQMEMGQGSSFADRIYRSLKSRIGARRALSKPVYSLADRLKGNADEKEVISTGSSIDDGYNSDHENKAEEQIRFHYRRPYSHEVWDRFGQPDCSLLPRLAPLNERDPIIQELVDRALCLSNLIRGLAFVPINCRYMHSHKALLSICSKLLMLCVKEDEQQRRAKNGRNETTNMPEKEVKLEQEESSEPIKDNNNVEEPVEQRQKPRPTTIDDHFNADDSTKFRVKQCEPERDGNDKLLLETANLLRDDAFVILSQLSVHLDLYGMESEISYPLFDSLIHWAITTNIQAQDPIHLGAISPRAYVFEIISKLSLLDKNIDLLLSTGAWPRIEEFVRVVCNSITMSEELPLREFAIVILQAISVASEPVCIVATMQTQVIQNLISFLEIADQAMTAIASNDGLTALRDNTERIGTSIGMLRRAIQILYNFVQYEPCRPYFVRYQDKLLSFTVSSIMDSRVAITAASILYDIQNLQNDLFEKRELTSEDYRNLSDQFHSCNWRLNDTDEELEDRPIFPSINLQLSQDCGSNSALSAGQQVFLNEPSIMNGMNSIAINGNSKPKRKRLHQHEDGREMSALELELLRDSDAESIEGDDDTIKSSEHKSTIDQIQQDYHPISNELSRKTVSDSVKEKLHNHIMKHEHEEALVNDGPDAKRQKIVGNGVLTTTPAPPKCNGDLNNTKRSPTSTTNPQQSENGTAGNGSMTAVA